MRILRFTPVVLLALSAEHAVAQCFQPRMSESTESFSASDWVNDEWASGRFRWNGLGYEPLYPWAESLDFSINLEWNGGTAIFAKRRDEFEAFRPWFWDGERLTLLGTPPNWFAQSQLLSVAGTLYLAGPVSSSPEFAPMARWDGQVWRSVRSASTPLQSVEGIVEFGGATYAVSRRAGLFKIVNDVAYRVGEINSNSEVHEMVAIEQGVLVAGSFTTMNGLPMRGVALWNGSVWEDWTDPAISQFEVSDLTVIQGQAVAFGRFVHATDGEAGAAVIDPSGWAIEAGLPPPATLVAAGPLEAIVNSGGAGWHGRPGRWGRLPSTPRLNGTIHRLGEFDGSTYATGSFISLGGVSINHIARRGTFTWEPLGDGLSDPPVVLRGFGGHLYAGGQFMIPGSPTLQRFARWNGSTWSAIPANAQVQCLIEYGDELLLGGGFTSIAGTSVSRLALWDGQTARPFPNTFNGAITTTAVIDGQLYVGGTFQMAGTMGRIARWDGSQWLPLGGGLNVTPNEIIGYRGDVFVRGGFTQAGEERVLNGIAAWDGQRWVGFPEMPFMQHSNSDFVIYRDRLILIGVGVRMPGDNQTAALAAWDGQTLEYSPVGGIVALVRDDVLEVGSSLLRRVGCPCDPPVATDIVAAVCVGRPGVISFNASGQGGIRYVWRRNGVEFANSVNSRFDIQPEAILPGDIFDCLILNECGVTRVGPFRVGACPADFTCDAFLDWFDVMAFWDAFDAGNPSADINHDRFIDFFDAIDYLDAFAVGC